MNFFLAPMIAHATDFQAMADLIETKLTKSLTAYKAADYETAQDLATRAYFQVFENMEGPIRVNISQRHNFMLELQFSKLRKIIDERVDMAEVAPLIHSLIEEVQALPPRLIGGHTIQAESDVPEQAPAASTGEDLDPELQALLNLSDEEFATEDDPAPATQADKASPSNLTEPTNPTEPVDPHWLKVRAQLENYLREAADALARGDVEAAHSAITQAQYEGYKNSMLETAIRRHTSHRQDAEINLTFARLHPLLTLPDAQELFASGVQAILEMIDRLLPGLPVPEQALSTREAHLRREGKETAHETETLPLFASLEALQKTLGGLPQESMPLAKSAEIAEQLKSAYFEHYEDSGLQALAHSKAAGQDETFRKAFARLLESILQPDHLPSYAESLHQTRTALADLQQTVQKAHETKVPVALATASLLAVSLSLISLLVFRKNKQNKPR